MEGMSKMGEIGGEGIAATTTSEDGPTMRSEVCSESSSSIRQPDDDEEEEEEVHSTLSSLASLEDSLPIKKGLSNFYGGKSKSYGNLGQVQDLGKSDNPFNKRRRTLMAYNLMFNDAKSKKHHHNTTTTTSTPTTTTMNNKMASNNKSGLFYAHYNHISMPLLPLAEDHNDNDNGVHDSSDDYYAAPTTSFLPPPPRLQHQP